MGQAFENGSVGDEVGTESSRRWWAANSASAALAEKEKSSFVSDPGINTIDSTAVNSRSAHRQVRSGNRWQRADLSLGGSTWWVMRFCCKK